MLTLLFTSWIALYAQIGRDTLAVYNQSELVKIANMSVRVHECDSLLNITNKQLDLELNAGYAYRLTIHAKNKELDAANSIVVLKEQLIAGKDAEITGLRDINKKSNRKLKWTRIGWLSTSAILTYIILTR